MLKTGQGVRWPSPGLFLGTGTQKAAGSEGERESMKVPTSCRGFTHTEAQESRPGWELSWEMGREGSKPASLLGRPLPGFSSPCPGLNDWELVHTLSLSLPLPV